MAPKATIFKVDLSVADMVRQYYEDHQLTLARHPSETDVRMLMRVMVFALNAHERLRFGKGLSTAEEPDLWQIGLTGDIEHWIDLGQPTEKRIRQACGKAARVSIYTYQKGAAGPWFESISEPVARFRHLKIIHLQLQDEGEVTRLLERNMRLSCTIEEGQATLAGESGSIIADMVVAKS